MLFGETVAVYSENNMNYIHKLCGQNSEDFYVKPGGAYNYRRVLKRYIYLPTRKYEENVHKYE
jgi:hypothetical protein